jgi:hypothetical protein
MTRVCCPSCRLRFNRAAAAYLVTCPQCGSHLDQVSGAQHTLGFRLFEPDELPESLPDAMAIAMQDPDFLTEGDAGGAPAPQDSPEAAGPSTTVRRR